MSADASISAGVSAAPRAAASGAGAERKPKVIVISGPTGVGKTDLSVALAESLGGEIVSADSVQVYVGMDVGSNKVPREVRERVPHHMIDVAEPTNQFNAGEFVDAARAATDAILARGRVPIVVGGTGLYLRWFLYGKGEGTAPADSAVRERVKAELGDQKDWPGCLAKLAAVDPEHAASLFENDWYRLSRALEIIASNGGKPVPRQFRQSDDADPTLLDYDFRCFFLVPERHELNHMIDARCDVMVEEGLLTETLELLRNGLDPDSTVGRAIGYRQAAIFLGQLWALPEAGAEEEEGRALRHRLFTAFLADFKTASRRYVKRQLAWFRAEPLFRWTRADPAAGAAGRAALAERVRECYGLSHEAHVAAMAAEGAEQAAMREESRLDAKGRKVQKGPDGRPVKSGRLYVPAASPLQAREAALRAVAAVEARLREPGAPPARFPAADAPAPADGNESS